MAFLHDPTFWVFVAFVIFVVAFFKPAKRAVLGGLDARIAQIRTEVEEAQRLREEAQTLLAGYQRKQRQAMQEAEEIVARAKAEAKRLAAEGQREIEAALARQEQQAMEKIAQAEANAVKEVRGIAVDIAIAATERILSERLAGADGDHLVDAAIRELPGKLQ